jgi:uncharacterized protein (TIGR03000 family)
LTTAVPPGQAGARELTTAPLPSAAPLLSVDSVARVVVRVPDDAQVEFGGVFVEQTGRVRRFTTPPLTPGQKYTYDVRAAWTENGRPVAKERQIIVFAGEKVDIDFLRPDEESGARELRTRPLPAPAAAPLKPTLPPARP